jgi:hypothetical protein
MGSVAFWSYENLIKLQSRIRTITGCWVVSIRSQTYTEPLATSSAIWCNRCRPSGRGIAWSLRTALAYEETPVHRGRVYHACVCDAGRGACSASQTCSTPEVCLAGVSTVVAQDHALDGAAFLDHSVCANSCCLTFCCTGWLWRRNCSLCSGIAELASAPASAMEAPGHSALFLYAQCRGPVSMIASAAAENT